MFSLTNFDLRSMVLCGQHLRDTARGGRSMEEVASKITDFLYERLMQDYPGLKACALVRCFKTHRFGDLDDSLQQFALDQLSGPPTIDDFKCLTLLASRGEQPEWNGRGGSSGHRAIPLAGPEQIEKLPMVRALLQQMGVEIKSLLEPDPNLFIETENYEYGVFFVPQALGSPYIPAQDTFVKPFGIQSVIGFGGRFLDGDMFTVILFTKCHLNRQVAELFRTVALSARIALLPFERAVFNTAGVLRR